VFFRIAKLAELIFDKSVPINNGLFAIAQIPTKEELGVSTASSRHGLRNNEESLGVWDRSCEEMQSHSSRNSLKDGG